MSISAVLFSKIEHAILDNVLHVLSRWNLLLRSRISIVSSQQLFYENLNMARESHTYLRDIHQALQSKKDEASLTDVTEKYQSFHDGLTSFFQKLEGLAESSKRSNQVASKWESISENLLKQSEDLRTMHASLLKQWEAYCLRFEGVDKSLAQAFATTHESITSYSDRFKNLTQDFDMHMSRGILSLAGAVGDLQHAISTLPEVLKKDAKPAGKKAVSL